MKIRKGFLLFCFISAVVAVPFRAESQGQPVRGGLGLLVSLIQDPPVLSGRREIEELIRFARQARIRTLYVQVYYANRVWFRSNVGDPDPYETCARTVGEDPFALLIRAAHAAGIETYAWLNMLSLNDNANAPILKKYGPDILTKDANEKKRIEDYKIDRQYFLEPGDPRVRDELTAMIGGALEAYPDLDGILLDYIRYPDVHPVYGHAPQNEDRFRRTTGAKTIEDDARDWNDWRRGQVTELTAQISDKARTVRPGIRIGVTGCMPWARAYHEAFQDWISWVDRGLVDFAVAMNYSPVPETFERQNRDIRSRARDFKRVHLAIGAYKLERSPDLFFRELEYCDGSGSGSCVIFHYGNLLQSPALRNPLLSGGPLAKARDNEKTAAEQAMVF